MEGSDQHISGCYWQADRRPTAAAPPLAGDLKVDVAVIGGGYTGLATAYHLKSADPGLQVAVLEAETAGFGASGRNGGFVITLFGSSIFLMKALHGAERVRRAHKFMVHAIAHLEAMIAEHAIDCEYERTGFLKVATTPAYVSRIRQEVELVQSLGIDGVEWVDGEWLRSRIRSPSVLGAWREPGCGLLNPMKWLNALSGLACAKGCLLFEGTPVASVLRQSGRFRLDTPNGTVSAEKLVYATNGYTHLIPGMRSKQMPAFVYMVATAPLTPEQRAAVGWAGREGIEDGRNFMHFYRLSRDGRILAGGGPGLVPFGKSMDHDSFPRAWDHLERFIGETFPPLRGIAITHRWGGAFSMTPDFTPQIGVLHAGAAVFSVGCTGHGVAMTQMNGRIICDLILGRKSELTELWFVNHRSIPMPPEPVRSMVAGAVKAMMIVDDWWCERSGRRA
jgi:glycine/D-amino acid oxidase-like deaminating enzyme